MLTLDSKLDTGKYQGRKVHWVVSTDPQFLYIQYITDPDLDLHLDVVHALEKKGYNMRRASLQKMRNLAPKYLMTRQRLLVS